MLYVNDYAHKFLADLRRPFIMETSADLRMDTERLHISPMHH